LAKSRKVVLWLVLAHVAGLLLLLASPVCSQVTAGQEHGTALDRGTGYTSLGEFNGSLDSWTVTSGDSGTVDLLEASNVEEYDTASRPGWLMTQVGPATGYTVEAYKSYTIADGDSVVVKASSGVDADSYVTGDLSAPQLWLSTTTTRFGAGEYGGIYIDHQAGAPKTNHVSSWDVSDFDAYPGGKTIYLRATRDGSDISFWWSWDGLGWAHSKTYTWSTIPSYIWIVAGTGAANGDYAPIVGYDFVRYGSGNNDPWTLAN